MAICCRRSGSGRASLLQTISRDVCRPHADGACARHHAAAHAGRGFVAIYEDVTEQSQPRAASAFSLITTALPGCPTRPLPHRAGTAPSHVAGASQPRADVARISTTSRDVNDSLGSPFRRCATGSSWRPSQEVPARERPRRTSWRRRVRHCLQRPSRRGCNSDFDRRPAHRIPVGQPTLSTATPSASACRLEQLWRAAPTLMSRRWSSARTSHSTARKTEGVPASDVRALHGGAAAHRLQLEHDLKAALSRDEFRVVYMPLCDLATGRIIGQEALLRWDS